jgi:predicted nucleic acid-binding protein
MTVFIDTGAFYDFLIANSQRHEDAIETMKEIQNGRWGSIVTSNYILDELITLICNKTSHSVAAKGVGELRRSRSITFIFIDAQTEKRAWSIFNEYRDREISFTDYTSFAIIDILGIDAVFSNDKHFKHAGCEVL